MEIQAQIPAALAAVHNFICHYDPDKINTVPEGAGTDDHRFGPEHAGSSHPGTDMDVHTPTAEVIQQQDQIAEEMWNSYIEVLAQEAYNNENNVDNRNIGDNKNSEENIGNNENSEENNELDEWNDKE